MIKIRAGLKDIFRGATAEEYAIIHAAAAERRQFAEEERSAYPSPEVAERSIGGAFLWATLIVWHDHPKFVACGVAGALISTVARLWKILF